MNWERIDEYELYVDSHCTYHVLYTFTGAWLLQYMYVCMYVYHVYMYCKQFGTFLLIDRCVSVYSHKLTNSICVS